MWEQDKDDDDGLEYFVRHRIDADDFDWIPSNKAMRLDQAASEEEALQMGEFIGVKRYIWLFLYFLYTVAILFNVE